MLHLAISVFLYRADGSMLLQRRARSKYHFPGVWANACCSHPSPGESAADAAVARVEEELGLTAVLEPAGSIVYRATCASSGLVEHELDEIFVGVIDADPDPDPAEVAEVAWVTVDRLRNGEHPGALAPWFWPALERAEALRSGSGQALR
jgi:isopentenyl-diphosphate delta-isomerase